MRCFFLAACSLLIFTFNASAQVVKDNAWILDDKKVDQMLSTIQASASELKAQLYDNVAALGKVYRDLEREEFELASLTSFGKRQGQLPWPVAGHLIHRYGMTRINDERWKGIYIATVPEETVRVPHTGQVVFSDGLKGFGLLMIVDHQDGYMTLYGNNAVLLKKTGDFVKAGEVIAATGFGSQGYGLYFEIRKNGVPVNPKHWLSRL